MAGQSPDLSGKGEYGECHWRKSLMVCAPSHRLRSSFRKFAICKNRLRQGFEENHSPCSKRIDRRQATFYAESIEGGTTCVPPSIGRGLRGDNLRGCERLLMEGAVLGGLGAISGAFAGYHMRKSSAAISLI